MSSGRSYNTLAEDTGLVKLYPPVKHKTAWVEEAENRGSSLSGYLQELIQEARFLRDQGQLQIGDRRLVEQLQDEVEDLERQLENQSETRVNEPGLVDEELVQNILSENYQPFDQLLQDLLKNSEFQQLVRRELEARLYEMGEQSETSFRRGKGWKSNRGDG